MSKKLNVGLTVALFAGSLGGCAGGSSYPGAVPVVAQNAAVPSSIAPLYVMYPPQPPPQPPSQPPGGNGGYNPGCPMAIIPISRVVGTASCTNSGGVNGGQNQARQCTADRAAQKALEGQYLQAELETVTATAGAIALILTAPPAAAWLASQGVSAVTIAQWIGTGAGASAWFQSQFGYMSLPAALSVEAQHVAISQDEQNIGCFDPYSVPQSTGRHVE